MDRINLKNDYDALFARGSGKNLTVLDTEPFTVTHPKKRIAFESPFPETSFFEKIPANREHDVRNWRVTEVLLTASDSVEAKKHKIEGENPNAVWVQINKKGDYQFYGNLQSFINQEVILTVVWHIREKNASLSLADYSARELVDQLNAFSNKTGVKIKKNGGIFLKNVNPSNNIVEYDPSLQKF